MPIEAISAIIGLILTLLVFSYLIGDNPLFRIAIYLFIGVASGYAVVVVWRSVLMPRLFLPLLSADPNQLLPVVIPLGLSLSLLAKLSPRTSWLGSFAMAMLVGVGAATALSGAVIGTLIPQSRAAMDAFSPFSAARLIQGIFMLAGTALTLAYFQFSATRAADGTVRRNVILETLARVGRIFIAITLGVLFAGVYTAALTAMIERLKKANRDAKSLGVKQAPFMVLIGATMPSVLAEISFLTNRQEAALLKTTTYRQAIAEALFSGISKYQKSLKAAQTVAAQN